MVKAVIHINGKPLTIFGLSGENITRLAAGEPIHIHGGRTEQDIKDEIAKTFDTPNATL